MLTRPGRYLRLFLDEEQPLIDLIELLLHKSALSPEARAYAGHLLSQNANRRAGNIPDAAQKANLALVEPLTQREMEVLRLIKDGLSNREIAEKLYLTLNTVKVHIKNIFGKLDVQSRRRLHAGQKSCG